MKIAYHHRTRGIGAEGIHIQEIVNAFEKLGHKTKVFSLTNKNPGKMKNRKDKSIDINFKKLFTLLAKKFFPIIYNLPGYLYLKNKCKNENINFIYERYSLYNYVGVRVAKKLNIPLVLEVNAPFAYEVDEHESPLFSSFAKRVEKKIFNEADIIVVVSNSLKEYLINLGVNKNKIVVMHNGVNFNKFDHLISGDDIKEKYNLINKTIIGFVGGLEPHHGLDILFKAVNKLKSINNDVALLIVGDGSYKKHLKRLGNSLNLEVVFSGKVAHENVSKYIAAMDITVKPDANSYCSPMKIFEYMAMQKPVIAGYTPSVKEIINDDLENGLLVEVNVEGLEKGFKKLIHNKNLKKKLAKNGYNYVKRNYSWEKNAERVIKLVSELT